MCGLVCPDVMPLSERCGMTTDMFQSHTWSRSENILPSSSLWPTQLIDRALRSASGRPIS